MVVECWWPIKDKTTLKPTRFYLNISNPRDIFHVCEYYNIKKHQTDAEHTSGFTGSNSQNLLHYTLYVVNLLTAASVKPYLWESQYWENSHLHKPALTWYTQILVFNMKTYRQERKTLQQQLVINYYNRKGCRQAKIYFFRFLHSQMHSS